MNHSDLSNRALLQQLAAKAMTARGLLADFTPAATSEAAGVASPSFNGDSARDLRRLLWASIDNDDSRDLDQLSVAEGLPGDQIKVLVAIADVDAVVARLSAVEQHARTNTTSVYTPAKVFPMLPERLSTDITSLGQGVDRPAIVVEMVVAKDGNLSNSSIYPAWVRNQAKLAYHGVAAWLEGGPAPAALAAVKGLDENLRLQDRAAQALKALRLQHGALTFDAHQVRATLAGDTVHALELEQHNRATQLIEDFMVASNGVTARFLEAKKYPSLRRVVRTPKRWDWIVDLARQHSSTLPSEPDAPALSAFLAKQRRADPVRFPDLSLAIIKLLGPGEYVAELPGNAASPGHFSLAVEQYSHSTAPNRRYPDVITQRLLKAALDGRPSPYANDELVKLAQHCTQQEDAAKKVERQVTKSAAALLLQSRIGQQFDAIVTGAADKGTWVRVFNPPVEGRLVQGEQGMAVGRKLRVELLHTNVERGFIDFKRVG
jgi:exoribonuclease-2